MTKWMLKLWDDDRGAIIALEFLFLATILVIGIVVGTFSSIFIASPILLAWEQGRAERGFRHVALSEGGAR